MALFHKKNLMQRKKNYLNYKEKDMRDCVLSYLFLCLDFLLQSFKKELYILFDNLSFFGLNRIRFRSYYGRSFRFLCNKYVRYFLQMPSAQPPMLSNTIEKPSAFPIFATVLSKKPACTTSGLPVLQTKTCCFMQNTHGRLILKWTSPDFVNSAISLSVWKAETAKKLLSFWKTAIWAMFPLYAGKKA